MSIKLMSAIFYTEFPGDFDYNKDNQPRKAKASTMKLLLLALADHANDDGEGTYPGYDLLEIKTALSRQGIADTIEAAKQNGLISVEVRGSRLGTNDYKISTTAFPTLQKGNEQSKMLVKSLDYVEDGVVKPLDSRESSHLTRGSQATRLESSVNHKIKHHTDKDLLDGMIELAQMPAAKKSVRLTGWRDLFEREMRVNAGNRAWQEFLEDTVDAAWVREGFDPKKFIAWMKAQPNYAATYWPPRRMAELYPQAFTDEAAAPRHADGRIQRLPDGV